MVSATMVNSWFQYWQRRSGACIRLFCFPYAGGGASIFRTWSEHLPHDIEVCPVQLPGREDRLLETPFARMPLLVDSLAQVLRPYLDMPYAFFGQSMGALISFELARHIRRAGSSLEPVHLFVAGHQAPQLPSLDPPTYHLPEQEFIEELRRLKGTPESVLQNAEFLRLLLPLLRADFALCETYSYSHDEPFTCPISAFSGLQDTEVSHDGIDQWRIQTSGHFRSRFFEGDHFFVHHHQAALLQALSQDLLHD